MAPGFFVTPGFFAKEAAVSGLVLCAEQLGSTLRARTADFQAVRKKQDPVPYVTLYAVTLCPVQVEGGPA